MEEQKKGSTFGRVLIVLVLLSLGALLAYIFSQQENERTRLEQKGPQATAEAGKDRATTTNTVGEGEVSDTVSLTAYPFAGTWKAEPSSVQRALGQFVAQWREQPGTSQAQIDEVTASDKFQKFYRSLTDARAVI